MNLFEHADHAGTIAAIRDLLEHPRHTVTPKDRKWLKALLRDETARPGHFFEAGSRAHGVRP